MHTEDDFYAAMKAEPNNCLLIGLLADWYEENDKPVLAEAARLLFDQGKVGLPEGGYQPLINREFFSSTPQGEADFRAQQPGMVPLFWFEGIKSPVEAKDTVQERRELIYDYADQPDEVKADWRESLEHHAATGVA